MSALARLAERRFPSFSEAADAVLDLLEGELPEGSLLVGQVDADGDEYRLIDVRGAAGCELQAGTTLPLRDGLLEEGTLAALSVRSYLAVPLETNIGGKIAVCALAPGRDVYTRGHLDLIAIAGRLLTYEWESVRMRADLRRLSERLRDPERTDSLTGLNNRTSFVELFAREWHLVDRGSTETFLVILRMPNLAEVGARHGEGLKELLLKDAAEVLEAAIRRSDHAGRLLEDGFGVVLVGCKGAEGAEAFFRRFEQGLARVCEDRPASLSVTSAIKSLGDCDTPDALLAETEAMSSRERPLEPA